MSETYIKGCSCAPHSNNNSMAVATSSSHFSLTAAVVVHAPYCLPQMDEAAAGFALARREGLVSLDRDFWLHFHRPNISFTCDYTIVSPDEHRETVLSRRKYARGALNLASIISGGQFYHGESREEPTNLSETRTSTAKALIQLNCHGGCQLINDNDCSYKQAIWISRYGCTSIYRSDSRVLQGFQLSHRTAKLEQLLAPRRPVLAHLHVKDATA